MFRLSILQNELATLKPIGSIQVIKDIADLFMKYRAPVMDVNLHRPPKSNRENQNPLRNGRL
jgi:hypothetical protein